MAATITATPGRRPHPDAAGVRNAHLPERILSAVTSPRPSELRLVEHVDRLGQEHPPIDLATVDFTVRQPTMLNARYGHVLDYMARVELEVDRNVLELTAMLPDPPEIDRVFYADVWQPQEIRHGQILDELQTRIGRPPAEPDLTHVSAKIRILGALGHVSPIQDVVRMLYYLTGMATERSAVLAYNLLYDGVTELGETAVAETVVAQIRRQEPGHYAFYKMSARGLCRAAGRRGSASWSGTCAGSPSRPSAPTTPSQKADFGDLMASLGIDRDLDDLRRPDLPRRAGPAVGPGPRA